MKKDAIKNLREKYGWSRAEFCRLFSIPIRTVENWDNENHTAYPNKWTENLIINAMIDMHRKQIYYKVKNTVFGKEMTICQLDEEMEKLGFNSELSEIDALVLSAGSISYLLEERDNGYNDYVDISFEIVNDNYEFYDDVDIDTITIKIKDVDII